MTDVSKIASFAAILQNGRGQQKCAVEVRVASVLVVAVPVSFCPTQGVSVAAACPYYLNPSEEK